VKRAVLVAAAGAVLGFLAESVHRRAGVWVLTGGGSLPLWIGPVYFAGLLGAVLALARFERRRPGALGRPNLVFEAALLVALFLAPPLLHQHELRLAGLALAVLVARQPEARAPGDVTVALLVAAADLGIEGALVAADLFRYRNASLGPFPLWLAPLWAAMAPSLRRIFAALQR